MFGPQTGHVLRHGRRKHDDAVDFASLQQLVHPGLQFAVAIVRHCHRTTGKQSRQSPDFCSCWIQPNVFRLTTYFRNGLCVLPVILIVDECSQVHSPALGEPAQQIIGTNLVAFIWRVRNSVAEVQEFLHISPRARRPSVLMGTGQETLGPFDPSESLREALPDRARSA